MPGTFFFVDTTGATTDAEGVGMIVVVVVVALIEGAGVVTTIVTTEGGRATLAAGAGGTAGEGRIANQITRPARSTPTPTMASTIGVVLRWRSRRNESGRFRLGVAAETSGPGVADRIPPCPGGGVDADKSGIELRKPGTARLKTSSVCRPVGDANGASASASSPTVE